VGTVFSVAAGAGGAGGAAAGGVGSLMRSLMEGPDFTVEEGAMKLCVEGAGVFGLAGSGTTVPGFLALP